MARRLLYRIHLWLSVPLGIFITLICLSGATLVFKHEIREALGMPRVVAPHGTHHASPETAKEVSTKHPHGVCRADASASSSVHGQPAREMLSDKNAGHGHGTTTRRDFFSYVTRFHTSLMLGTWGKVLVTYTTILFLLILVSGLWICWPQGLQQWRKRFRVEWGRGVRRLFFDLHVSLGFWAVLWLVLLAVTGAAFGLHLLPRGTAIIKVFHALHVGAWGGMVTKIITFVVSLIGALLPLTGYWLYFKKRQRKGER
ncbi:MAG: PepSY domain-containing protein [Prevotella sp.]|nr:PepSY domain-containing protein [Prevotella sp.]MDD7046625.1 PepSY-associated TM helix domain-containing protein [Prevotella sp.]MDY5546858.1 PepSY-associated TM helix domain-containing protein [Prevotella sp.]